MATTIVQQVIVPTNPGETHYGRDWERLNRLAALRKIYQKNGEIFVTAPQSLDTTISVNELWNQFSEVYSRESVPVTFTEKEQPYRRFKHEGQNHQIRRPWLERY